MIKSENKVTRKGAKEQESGMRSAYRHEKGARRGVRKRGNEKEEWALERL